MEIIIMKKGHGKTKRLIEMSSEKWVYIVCRSYNDCARIADMARNMNINIPFPISYDEFHSKGYYGKGINGFLIDQLEDYVQYTTRVTILAATITDSTIDITDLNHENRRDNKK